MEAQVLLGENLRTLRAEAGLTQMELANAADMDMAEISRYERGVRDPRLSTIVRLADALGVSPARCMRGLGRYG